MKAIQPDSSSRGFHSARSALSIATVTMLLFVAAFSVMTTGCSDDDACCAGSGSDAGGLGGQTYTSDTFVGGIAATLVVVPRGGGSTSAAATGGILADDLAAGPVDGLLVLDPTGVREILSGTFDPGAAEGAPQMTVTSAGGVTFAGDASPATLQGILTVDNIDVVPNITGPGRQEDAPLIHLLGSWQHNTTVNLDCGSLGPFTINCQGNTRIRKIGLRVRMDRYETCNNSAKECVLSGPVLTDGTWSGLNYSEAVDSTVTFDTCILGLVGNQNLSVNTQTLDSTTTGDATFANSLCLPLGTECTFTQTMTATRCTNCWPEDCNDGI